MTSIPLTWSALGRLGAAVTVPRYDRKQISPGIVHLGVGNFHRAHQAMYVDDVLNAGEHDWGIVGVSLRRGAMRDALAPQGGLYSLIEQGPSTKVRVIGALQSVLVAPESPPAVIAAIADPRIRIVSLTITEKGYCLNAARDGPDWRHPDIAADLANRQAPRTAIALILSALRLRQQNKAPGLTLLSCDNLANNGDTLRRLLRGFAEASAPDLLAFLDDSVCCPSTMVDRIVPHTTAALRAQLRDHSGVDDAWPVATEPFSQWVIEDRFASGRPNFEAACRGSPIQFVTDVAPFEAMKLRLLNAAHSAIAYLGVPAGWPTVDVAVAQPALRSFIERLWAEELIPSLPPAVQRLAPAYVRALLERFDNPALGHKTLQIAMDGSQKIPLRWLPSLRFRMANGLSIDGLAMCLAAWLNYLASGPAPGQPGHPIDDPQAERLREIAMLGDTGQRVARLLAEASIFGDLAHSTPLRVAVARALADLRTHGTGVALARAFSQ